MKAWKHKINIAQYIGEDDSNNAVVIACKGVVSELSRLPAKYNEEGLTFFIKEFSNLAGWASDKEDPTEWADEFNYNLEDLYNWADYERIWLGI